MGKVFTLTPSIKQVISDALDDLITELGKDCRLVYPPRMVSCDNCAYDPIGRKSSNVYLDGGPIPFQNESCPLCNGVGQQAQAQTEIIKFLCAFHPKDFFLPMPNLDIKTPFSIVQTKGFLTDAPKVKRAMYLVFQVAIENILGKKYELNSDPADVSNIIQGRYFVATWKQIT